MTPPGVDIGADIAMMLEMINAINRKFGLSAEQLAELNPQLKAQILLAAAGIGSKLVGRVLTRRIILLVLQKAGARWGAKTVLKLIPIAGQLLAAAISFGTLKAVGNAHIDDCYSVLEPFAVEELPDAPPESGEARQPEGDEEE